MKITVPGLLLCALVLGACSNGPASMTGEQRIEMTDTIVRTDPSVSGEIPPADPEFRF
ncbi:hypothetical protein [Amaricoccus tamworthensis]|uniref:hypothetical protein n=1 Tax=Amaricoccus tamworthensis TaxID=57002 RepID=UPI003C7D17C5